MERSVYALETEIESKHWWFVGRRWLLSRLIETQGMSPHSQVLDVGTGTGTNLRLLKELGFSYVIGMDLSEDAIRFCQQKGLGLVKRGNICAMPFEDAQFDVVFATDIIEHIDDDLQALSEIERVLKPGGKAVIMVPAFQVLWGVQDRVSHHKRRYRLPKISRKIHLSGLTVCQSYYFNYILFLPIFFARQIIDKLNLNVNNENQINTRWLNSILTYVFRWDIWTASILKPPFGVSILAIAAKPNHMKAVESQAEVSAIG